MKRNKPITTLVHKHEHQTLKVKHKSKRRAMQPQDNTKMCEEFGKKPLRHSPNGNRTISE